MHSAFFSQGVFFFQDLLENKHLPSPKMSTLDYIQREAMSRIKSMTKRAFKRNTKAHGH